MRHLHSAALLILLALIALAVPAQARERAPAPTAPKEAMWQLYCRSFSGPGHVHAARQYRDAIERSTGLKDFHLVHREDASELYFGHYGAIDGNDAERDRVARDRKQLDELRDASGRQVFPFVALMPLDTPDPTAPPEWNLENAKGYWSVQIAAYKDHPQRKQAAVDAVREARARGIEAYYFHGSNVSSVCIGAWPAHAVKQQSHASDLNRDASKPVMVSTVPLPSYFPKELETPEGESVTPLEPKAEPIDPKMIAVLQEYPEHIVNGLRSVRRTKDPRTGQTVEQPEPSFLVVIPERQASLLGPSQEVAEQAPFGPAVPHQPAVPAKPAPPGAGRLRGLGD